MEGTFFVRREVALAVTVVVVVVNVVVIVNGEAARTKKPDDHSPGSFTKDAEASGRSRRRMTPPTP